MEHVKAWVDAKFAAGAALYAWRAPGGKVINLRFRWEGGEWGKVLTYHMTQAEHRQMSLAEWLDFNYYLEAEPFSLNPGV